MEGEGKIHGEKSRAALQKGKIRISAASLQKNLGILILCVFIYLDNLRSIFIVLKIPFGEVN